MAQINKPSDYFNTKLYTGNGSTQSITGVGFQPDFTWIKDRTTSNSHYSANSIMGANISLPTNGTNAEITNNAYGYMTSFDSDGFSLTNGASGSETVNFSGDNYASWNWLASNTTASNTDGSITSTVSANTTSGFSIVSYTGTGSSGATIGHGLGVAPKMIIAKNRSIASNWLVYNYSMSANGDYALFLDSSSAKDNSQDYWGDTEPTSSVFTVGSRQEANGSGNNIIAYCFAEKKGFSKFGSWIGNGSTDGTFVYTGFKPSFIIGKNTSRIEDWFMLDNKRDTFNPVDERLQPNSNGAEVTVTTLGIDFCSNGFKLRGATNQYNASGETMIYMAFAESPLVGTNNIPATAR